MLIGGAGMPLVRSPMYQQLHDLLLESLRGEYRPGAQFLTEREIGARFGVSRATANKALAALVAEGQLEFRKGVGTFVSGRKLEYDLRSLVSFTDKASACGYVPSTRVRLFKRLEAGPAGSPLADVDVWFVDRFRLANEAPVIHERRWVNAQICSELSRDVCAGSLYAFWTDVMSLEIAGAEQRLKVIALSSEQAAGLAAQPGAPAFEVHATGTLTDGRVLWVEETVYRGDRYEFETTLGPVTSRRGLTGRLLPGG